MRDLMRAEWAKARTGRAWLICFGIGVFLLLVSNFGIVSQGAEQLVAGRTDIPTLTNDLVRNGFALLLFASLYGAIIVTREYSSGSISRSVLLSGGRRWLLVAKVRVGFGIGLLSGVLAVLLAFFSTVVLLGARGHEPVFTRETYLIGLGVLVVNALAGPWGVLLGWIIRNQAGSVLVVVGLSLVLEPTVQKFLPEVGKFLPTIAMSSIYRDVKPELLTTSVAFAVVFGWLAVAGLVAWKSLSSRDIT